ncbi:MAG: hypothetical protein ACO1O3_16960, partial [Sphingobium sp.]
GRGKQALAWGRRRGEGHREISIPWLAPASSAAVRPVIWRIASTKYWDKFRYYVRFFRKVARRMDVRRALKSS